MIYGGIKLSMCEIVPWIDLTLVNQWPDVAYTWKFNQSVYSCLELPIPIKPIIVAVDLLYNLGTENYSVG